MKKKAILFFLFLVGSSSLFAYWEWTPQTRKWINPKFAPKESPEAQWEYAQEYRDSGKYTEALREYKKLLRYYGTSSFAPKALEATGEIYAQKKKLKESFQAYQEIVLRYPNYPELSEVLKKQREVSANMLGRQPANKGIRRFLADTGNAAEKAESVLAADPYSQESAELSMKLATYYAKKKEFEKSEAILEKVITDFPQTKWEDDARYEIIKKRISSISPAATDREEFDKLEDLISEYLRDFPNSPHAEEMRQSKQHIRETAAAKLFAIAKFYERTGKKSAAKNYYQRIVSLYPDTKYGKDLAPSFPATP